MALVAGAGNNRLRRVIGGIAAGNFAVGAYRNLYNAYQAMRRNFRSGNTRSRFSRNIGVAMRNKRVARNNLKSVNKKPRVGYAKGWNSGNGGGGDAGPTGFYQGKVRGVVQRRKVKKGSIYDVTGYRKETEQYGSVTGSGGLVRLGVKAYPADDMLIGIWIVVIRYLLKKHYNFVYTDPDAVINYNNSTPLDYGRPNDLTIRFARDTGPGSRSIIAYNARIPPTMTIRGLATDVALWYLSTFSTTGTNPDQKDEYYPLDYKFQDSYYNTAGYISGDENNFFPFAGMKIALYGKAEIVVQNTSRHDSSTSNAVGFVDNNPLCGNVVYVKGQTVDPKDIALGTPSVGGNELGMNYVQTSDGVIFSGTAVGQKWKAIQPLSMFKRGVKQISGINLDPGASQKIDVYYQYNGYLSTFLMKYWPDSLVRVPGTVSHGGTASRYGGLNMIALVQLEKRLSTGGQPTTVNYHVDFHIGVRVMRGPSQPRWTIDYAERNIDHTGEALLKDVPIAENPVIDDKDV